MRLSVIALVLLVGLLAKFQLPVFSQICLGVSRRGSSDPGDPPYNDKDAKGLPASPAVQAIVPTYKFYCDCVNITSWGTCVHPGDVASGSYDITFQVWRPSRTVTSDNGYEGEYSLVGQNVFARVVFPRGGFVYLSPTPPSNSIITAQSGDVVGYYTYSRNGINQGIQLEIDIAFAENKVWYRSFRSTGPLSVDTLSAGSEGMLDLSIRAAPMLRINTRIVPCPSIGPTTSYKDAPTPTMSTSLASHTSSVSTSIFPFPSANAVSVTSTNNVAIITGDFSASVDDRFLPSLTLSPTVVMPSTGFNSSAIADHISSEGLKPFTDLQNTSSSRNNDSFDNTRTLIIITLIPGFAVILILIFLSMCIILIRIKSSATQSKDATSNADLNNGIISMEPNEAYMSAQELVSSPVAASNVNVNINSGYGRHSSCENSDKLNTEAEITLVGNVAYRVIRDHFEEGNHYEDLPTADGEDEYSYIDASKFVKTST